MVLTGLEIIRSESNARTRQHRSSVLPDRVLEMLLRCRIGVSGVGGIKQTYRELQSPPLAGCQVEVGYEDGAELFTAERQPTTDELRFGTEVEAGKRNLNTELGKMP